MLFRSTDLQLSIPFRLSGPPIGENEPTRWMPVFDTREAAEAWTEGKYPVMEMHGDVVGDGDAPC